MKNAILGGAAAVIALTIAVGYLAVQALGFTIPTPSLTAGLTVAMVITAIATLNVAREHGSVRLNRAAARASVDVALLSLRPATTVTA